MLKALVRSRMASMYSSIFPWTAGNGKYGRLNMVLIVLIALIVGGSILTAFSFLFGGICVPLLKSKLNWLYFSLAGLISFIALFISNVLLAQSQLYETKDNELLLAMPIPPGLILASRLSALLATNYAVESLMLIPAYAIYCLNAATSLGGFLFFLVVFLVLPFLSLALSGVIGWLLAYISSKIRNRSLIVTALSIGFLLLYFYVFSKINGFVGYLIEIGAAVADAIRRTMFPLYHLGVAIAEHNLLSLTYFVLCAVLPFVSVYLLASRNFIPIATAHIGTSRKEYNDVPLKQSRTIVALVKKELACFFSKPEYILNASFGAIFTLLLPIVIFFKKDMLFSLVSIEMAGVGDVPVLMLLFVLCTLTSINIVSAPSISLEGKNLWIMLSIPSQGSDVLLSKTYAHIVICLPTVIIAAMFLNFMMSMGLAMRLLLFAVPAALTVLEALAGVCLNLRFPRFDWISETTAIKQGVSTLAAMFLPMLLIAGSAALYCFVLVRLIPVELYLSLFFALVSALSLGMLTYLKNKGAKSFALLGS